MHTPLHNMYLVETLCRISGQVVNLEKSSIHLGPDVLQGVHQSLAVQLPRSEHLSVNLKIYGSSK